MCSSIKFTLSIISVLFFVLEFTQAFCIYNRIDEGGPTLHFYSQPETKSSFKKSIGPGGVECCHWSDKDCNDEGGQEDRVIFKLNIEGYETIVSCEAGGSMVFTGRNLDDILNICTNVDGFQEGLNVIRT